MLLHLSRAEARHYRRVAQLVERFRFCITFRKEDGGSSPPPATTGPAVREALKYKAMVVALIICCLALAIGMYLCYVEGYNNGVRDLQEAIDKSIEEQIGAEKAIKNEAEK